MKTQSFFRTAAAALLLTSGLLFIQCKGPQGDPGPAGPQGQQGVAGPKGDPGTANVIYSPWLNVSFSGSGTSYTGTITAPQITQDVLDKADIRVYWSENGRVITLPYSQSISGTTYTVHQRFYVGRIELLSSYSLTTTRMRYVIIPGGTPTGRKAAIDYSNYEEVKKAYNLPD